MLKINPSRRISLGDAMAHAYVEEFREDALEQPAGFDVEMADVEEVKLTKKNLQRMMYEEVRAFHRQQAAAAAGPAGEDDSKMPDDEMPSQGAGSAYGRCDVHEMSEPRWASLSAAPCGRAVGAAVGRAAEDARQGRLERARRCDTRRAHRSGERRRRSVSRRREERPR